MNYPHNINKFNIRFLLDCYHYILFEISGMYYSDAYIV